MQYQRITQLPENQDKQLLAYEKRRSLTSLFSDLTSVRNPQRDKFLKEFEELTKQYLS